MKDKKPFTLFSVVAENLGNNELGLKTKKKKESENLVSNQHLTYETIKESSKVENKNPVYLLTPREILKERDILEKHWTNSKKENERMEELNIHSYRIFKKTLSQITRKDVLNLESESENLVSNQIKNKIKEFHDYLNEGISLDKAKKLIFDSTVYYEVKQYVTDYVAANQNFTLDINQYSQPEKSKNCKKDMTEILRDYKILFSDLNDFNEKTRKKLLDIESRLYKLMEDH